MVPATKDSVPRRDWHGSRYLLAELHCFVLGIRHSSSRGALPLWSFVGFCWYQLKPCVGYLSSNQDGLYQINHGGSSKQLPGMVVWWLLANQIRHTNMRIIIYNMPQSYPCYKGISTYELTLQNCTVGMGKWLVINHFIGEAWHISDILILTWEPDSFLCHST